MVQAYDINNDGPVAVYFFGLVTVYFVSAVSMALSKTVWDWPVRRDDGPIVKYYDALTTGSKTFRVPPMVYGIVWFLAYTCMGISAAVIFRNEPFGFETTWYVFFAIHLVAHIAWAIAVMYYSRLISWLIEVVIFGTIVALIIRGFVIDVDAASYWLFFPAAWMLFATGYGALLWWRNRKASFSYIKIFVYDDKNETSRLNPMVKDGQSNLLETEAEDVPLIDATSDRHANHRHRGGKATKSSKRKKPTWSKHTDGRNVGMTMP